MDREKLNIFVFYSDIASLTVAIIFLLLNIDNISVIHAWASPSLPVIKYETYSSLGILSLYILIVLAVINIIIMKIKKLLKIRHFTFIFMAFVSFFFIFVLLLNPHLLILNPTGLPPTQLDRLETGGIISIILFVNLTINPITSLWIERKF